MAALPNLKCRSDRAIYISLGPRRGWVWHLSFDDRAHFGTYIPLRDITNVPLALTQGEGRISYAAVVLGRGWRPYKAWGGGKRC